MAKKPSFKPRITRIKLNPEQAVLACNCYDDGNRVRNIGNTAMGPLSYTYCPNNLTKVKPVIYWQAWIGSYTAVS